MGGQHSASESGNESNSQPEGRPSRRSSQGGRRSLDHSAQTARPVRPKRRKRTRPKKIGDKEQPPSRVPKRQPSGTVRSSDSEDDQPGNNNVKPSALSAAFGAKLEAMVGRGGTAFRKKKHGLKRDGSARE